MSTLESRWTAVDGLDVHALASPGGDGPSILMVHGLGVSAESLRRAGESLARAFRVLIPDLPGHGRSGAPPHVPDIAETAAVVGRWLDASGLRRVGVFGQSVGCQVAVELAVQRPDLVSCLVLQGPTVDPHARGWLPQLFRWSVNGWLEGPAQLAQTVRGWRQAGVARVARTAGHAIRHPVEERLPRVAVPALVVRGERDPIVSPRWAREAADALPDGRLVTLPGAPHTVTTTDPDRVVDAVAPFLRAHGDRTGPAERPRTAATD